MKILMVCLGNICRSPLAQGIMWNKIAEANLDWEVDSAGTNHYQTGEPPHHLSQKVALQNGIDICDQCCRQFVREDMLRFDKIYVMDRENYQQVKKISGNLWDESKVSLLLNEVEPGKNKSVPDPWYGQERDYHDVYKMIDEACSRIVERYAE
ncbi:low molecular weight phosphotyrosine protein phosphatase [Segetibacter sp. 3557_3]|uniref:low molecular weight protein-tyrosine-phosphatase n=1 Tax=Segetibacter sp. 3557_3 TaxID=2547429 RepID=UPI0010588679|nr:low molecular weight protein-tyrosine-phosphatase [Segetibacter sp. 3557_3]TDH25527.1 low molecular weight phosphotyrosine protein phosphatase [Segetibacter sp. 3557_3]